MLCATTQFYAHVRKACRCWGVIWGDEGHCLSRRNNGKYLLEGGKGENSVCTHILNATMQAQDMGFLMILPPDSSN